jgi:class 3 adenylate cyclase/tetratricopeptide (TPR) repeat protein
MSDSAETRADTSDTTESGRATGIDDLLDRSVEALNRGDVATAHDLAERVLATDVSNRDAAALLGVEDAPGGQLRRLSLLFCDLVGSTELSARYEPETYRTLVRRYMAVCRDVVEDRYGGHISHVAGDGMLAVFGLPVAHENDAERAVRAGLDVLRGLRTLSDGVEAAIGERLEARAAVHRGLVYLDVDDDEVYGLAANVVARLHSLAAPGSVVMSEDVRAVVGPLFDTVPEPAQRAKGIDEPLRPHRVVAERPEAPSRGRRWAAPLVNRHEPLGRLRGVWADACEGRGDRPRAAHIVGEPGMGKSRLVAVLAEEAAEVDARCVQLLGSPFHADASFHPVRALVEQRCGLGPDAPPPARLSGLRDELAVGGLPVDEVVPLLAPVLGIPPDAGYRPVEVDARRLYEAIAAAAGDYVLALLTPGPALLLVEDLHWCDAATLDVLAGVMRAERGDLAVVTTSRDGPPPGLRSVTAIPLGPLDDEDARELVGLLDPALDDVACGVVLGRGDGVPLFLEELVRGAGAPDAALPAGPVAGAVPGSAPSVSAAHAGSTVAGTAVAERVPEALYEPLVARLHATGGGLPVAAAAATIGRDVDRRVLTRVVDMSERELEDALRALLGDLILERAVDDDRRYRFRHELLRVVAYEVQPPSRRRELHGRVAEALVQGPGGADAVDWLVVANHYDAAGRPDEAITAYERAADGARHLGALAEARAHLTRAIELVPELPDDPRRRSREVGLRLRRGFLAASAEGNNSPDVVHDYERCLELALGDVESDDMFSTLIPLYGHYMVRGDLPRAQQVIEMLRAGVAAGRDHYRPDNEAGSGTIRWFAGDFPAAHDQLEGAIAGVATRLVSPDYAATYFMPFDAPGAAHAGLALARFMRGDIRGADEQARASRRRCDAIDFPMGPSTAAYAEFYACWTRIERGDLAGAAAAAAEVGDIADRYGFDFWALMAANQRTIVDALAAIDDRSGNPLGAPPPDAAILAAHAEAVDAVCATWRMLDVGLFLPFAIAVAGRLRSAAGDAAAASARYDDALDVARQRNLHFYDAEVLRLRSQLLPAGAAEDQLRAALDLARAQGAVPFELRIARDLVAHGEEDARAHLAAAVSRFDADAHFPQLDEARAALSTPA